MTPNDNSLTPADLTNADNQNVELTALRPTRAEAEAEADKVRTDGAKAAEALSSKASGRTDAAVDVLLNAIHDA